MNYLPHYLHIETSTLIQLVAEAVLKAASLASEKNAKELEQQSAAAARLQNAAAAGLNVIRKTDEPLTFSSNHAILLVDFSENNTAYNVAETVRRALGGYEQNSFQEAMHLLVEKARRSDHFSVEIRPLGNGSYRKHIIGHNGHAPKL